jgi:hypothetical protein
MAIGPDTIFSSSRRRRDKASARRFPKGYG